METGKLFEFSHSQQRAYRTFRFTHFLDSGEQGLTVIVLFNDIKPRAGGTYIAPDGMSNVVKW